MATRRPASSRARLNYNASNMPPPQTQPSRSRSVMTKSASSSKSTEEEQHTAPTIATTSKHSEDSEMNIRVVLRCRRRSEREINENSPIIVSSSGAKSKELSIEASTPVSSLGVVTLPPVRTYPFDLVFGPEADQAMVYHEVVHPMLEEVLMGYNCTLFAYGQTGTGKTHTMQGDLQPTPMGNPSSNAGMIPRVLFRLFHHLESLNADYSVKISFIELYNEELRDLLASELSAPAGSTQPMGMTNKDNSKAPDGGLKIFDDAGKRGVIIQGLEEVAVKDCKDSLALLTKGSLRRQIASTKFNDHSSRSHSVFSITVHIKETSSLGDDLLKIGKLNLVDLAGSENIGRSGAENKRAREAGMINQSLLTLGRVINALVDKAQHVPYRESKLTRLLQDSLGGRTKTCIIATISPARSNMEETLSTLDYAMRAKSIRNKPELNQRMTRNSLLKEYVAEIDRLKADLLAAREKNGIFFSEETWNQLSAEQELRQTEINEAKKQIEIVENQMRSVREEFEQSIALLMKTDGELRHAKEKLKLTESTLEEKEENLKLTQIALHEEEIIKEAHHKSELTLDGIAAGLKGVTSETLQDIERLFEKLDRVTKLLVSNNHVVVENEKTVSTASDTLSHSLMDYCQQFTQSLAFLRSETKQFEGKEQDFLAECSKRIDQQISQVDILLVQCQSSDRSEAKILERINNLTKELETVLLKDTTIWGDEMKKTFVQIHRKVEETCRVQFTTLEKALESFYEIAQGVIRGTQSYIEKERVSVQEVQSLTEKAAAKEILHLKQQNQALLQLLTDERTTAAKAKEDVVQRVSVLLGEYVKERDSHLKQAIGNIQQQNEEAQESMNAFSDKHAEVVLGMGKAATTFGLSMQKGAEDTKRTRDAASKALIPAKEVLTGGFTEVQSKFTSSFERYSTRIHSQFQAARTSYDEALEGHSRAKRARIEATTSYSANVRPELQLAKRELALTSENLGNYVSKTVSTVTSLENSTKGYSEASLRQLSRIQQATEALSDEGAKEIIPSGRTPRKRKWRYVDQWSLTGSRDEVLKAWKAEQPIMSSNSEPPRNSIPELEYQDMDGDSSLSSLSSVSVHNSITSDETPPIPVIPIPDIDTVGQKPLKEKSRLPVIGTLVDSRRRNVYDTRRPR